jgi:hypothetical protein
MHLGRLLLRCAVGGDHCGLLVMVIAHIILVRPHLIHIYWVSALIPSDSVFVPVAWGTGIVAALSVRYAALDIVVLLVLTIISANFAFHFLPRFLFWC